MTAALVGCGDDSDHDAEATGGETALPTGTTSPDGQTGASGSGTSSPDGKTGGGGSDAMPSSDDPLFASETKAVAEWVTSEYYTCETEESACALPCSKGDLWVAINPTDFRASATCGACMHVVGPDAEVTVEVIENCAGACVDGEIELSRTAFEAIADLDEGRAEVRWKLVPCERSGPIQFAYEADSDEWWAGIQVRNTTRLVASLAIRLPEGNWVELERDPWNHFPVSADLGNGPFDFRITAIDGQVLTQEGIDYVPGGVVSGQGQFE